MERTIYNDDDFTDFDEWKKILIEYRKDEEEDDPENVTDREVMDYMSDTASIYFDDERSNLNKCLSGRVIAIADLGLWDGRRQGFKILSNNLNAIFAIGEDSNHWYDDGKDIRANMIHHDGTNRILFRELRDEKDCTNFLDRIYRGEEISRRTLAYYTRSLHNYVKEIYGW